MCGAGSIEGHDGKVEGEDDGEAGRRAAQRKRSD